MFAIICPFETPLPARRVNFAAVLLVSSVGIERKVPLRGESVRLPAPSWYMIKRFEFDIELPVPSEIHEKDVGAVIWK